MKPRQKRFVYIVVAVAAVGIAVGLVLNALKNNVSLYFTPTQIYNNEAPQGRSFRIGGLVEQGSVKREADGLTGAWADGGVVPVRLPMLGVADSSARVYGCSGRANSSAVGATSITRPR